MAMMTATVPVPLQKPLSFLKNGELAVRQRLKKTDPSHLNCFGDERFRLPTSFGKIIGWSIIGGLCATASNLEDTFLRLINEKRLHLQVYRPKNNSNPFHEPTFSLQSFLIGPDKFHASPHLTIVTAEEWIATSIKTIITESKILMNFNRWGCFKLPASITITCQATSHMVALPPRHSILGYEHEYEVRIAANNLPTYLDGTSIEIWKDDVCIGQTTVGGFLAVGDQTLALTVAHVFYPRQPASPMETFDIDESEFEFLLSGCLDCDDNDGEFSKAPYELSTPTELVPMPYPTMRLSSHRATISQDSFPRKTIGHLRYISDLNPDDNPTRVCLDWALLTITEPGIVKENRAHMSFTEQNVSTAGSDIYIIAASAAFRTELISSAVFGLSLNTSPQPVLVASDELTTEGDSGAWAIRTQDSTAIGMLIGNCPSLSQSYFLSMQDILSDVEAQTGLSTTVAPTQVFTPLELYGFRHFVDNEKCRGVDGNGKEMCYITAPKLREYWSCQVVSPVLHKLGLQNELTFESFSEYYIRLFSILTYICEPEKICWFRRRGLDDRDLPYEIDDQIRDGMENFFKRLEKYQWLFCPLEFDRSRLTRATLNPRIIIPITSQEMLPSLWNGKCVYTRVRIAEECSMSMPNNSVIFKTYDLEDTDSARTQASENNDWLYEIVAFEALQERGGYDHMVKYYGSFSQGTKGTIILEAANGIPLNEFLHQEMPPTDAVDGFQFWKNLFELLKGLARIHILPEAQKIPFRSISGNLYTNTSYWSCTCPRASPIMAYPATDNLHQQSTFKLMGFGLSLPHCDCEKDPATDIIRSRSRSDVWEFGKIVLDCISWMLLGMSDNVSESKLEVHEKSMRSAMGSDTPYMARLEEITQRYITHPGLNTATEFAIRFIADHVLIKSPAGAEDLLRKFKDSYRAVSADSAELGRYDIHSAGMSSTEAEPSTKSQNSKGRSQRAILSWWLGKREMLKSIVWQRQLEQSIAPRLFGRADSNAGGENHLFLVDDSASMKPYRMDVTEVIAALESIRSENDEISLYFTSDPVIGYHRTTDTMLSDMVRRRHTWGTTTMETGFEILVDRIITQVSVPSDKREVQPEGLSDRPMRIYVLTNGRWQSPRHEPKVEHAISRLHREVFHDTKDIGRMSVQFISFGNRETGNEKSDHTFDQAAVTSEKGKLDHTFHKAAVTFEGIYEQNYGKEVKDS
ncbi:hypothetical protein F5Y03DRAFT_398941 [Xylaria venustula]|nr:hypothetical protein F5Y03DRAFT_398941 [Xylaria venustula]